jgi:hypothetical protein
MADGLILLIVFFSFPYMFAATYTAISGNRKPWDSQIKHDIRIKHIFQAR